MTSQELLELFHARSGVVCAVGAGGKKTTLYRLLEAHSGRVGLTSTVFIPPFPKDPPLHLIRAEPDELFSAVNAAMATHRRIAYTGVTTKKGRFEGVAPHLVSDIHQRLGFDLTLVKADGARTRLIKAPAENEPQLPPEVTTVIPVVSARAIGQPLSERIAHRIEKIGHITGTRPEERVTPSCVARLLASEEGLLKGVGDAHVVPLINMVDDEQTKILALDAAEQALRWTTRFDQVVLGSMRNSNPDFLVVRR